MARLGASSSCNRSRQFRGTSTSASRVGWTAGAGVEYAFTYNWILGAEWLYYNLGSRRTAQMTISAQRASP